MLKLILFLFFAASFCSPAYTANLSSTANNALAEVKTNTPTNPTSVNSNPSTSVPLIAKGTAEALLLDIRGPIGPATQDFIERGILTAETKQLRLVILRLDTPGGLETSMRGINQAILKSKVPVVTFVAPSGARAASAGTFILYASHVAAMAPGTNLGAASPVQIGGPPTTENPVKEDGAQSAVSKIKQEDSSANLSTHEKKAMHDAAAYIRSLAEIYGRNATWGEKAVREAVSLSAEEAYQLKVIDVVAPNVPELLKKIDGRTVNILGDKQKLDSNNLEVNALERDWRYQLLSIITDPSIAYILLLIGIYGLFFEFSNPGFVLPGVAGSIALILALYAFQLLPINYAGVALLLLGLAFMMAEIFVSSFGALGIGGLIAFVAGSVLLLDTDSPNYQIAWEIIFLMTLFTGIFFLIVVNLAVRSHRKKVVTGKSAFIGTEGVILAINALHANTADLTVRVLGEIWQAKIEKPTAENTIKVGDTIRVEKIDGLSLTVSQQK